VYPNVAVVAGSFAEGTGHWRAFAASPADREALVTTLWISVASVAGAVLVGLPLALLLARAEFPGGGCSRPWRRSRGAAAARRRARLPPAVRRRRAWSRGSRAPRWGCATARGGSPAAWAIVFVHAYTMYVYVYLFVSAGLERLDPSLDEAAAGLGAGGLRRFRRVTLPLLTPALAGAMLLVFMSSLGSYSAPYVFGGGLRVLSTQIVASRLNGDDGMAYVETAVLAVSAVCAVLLLRWLEGRGPQVATLGKGVRAERRPVARGRARWLAAGAAAVAVGFLVLPHLALVLVAFAKDGAWTTELLPPVYTLDNWRRVTSDPELVRPVRNSVAMALAATGGTCSCAASRRTWSCCGASAGGGSSRCCCRCPGRCRPRPWPWGSRRPSTGTSPGVPLGARRHLGDPAARLLHPRRAAGGERGRGVAAADGPGDRGGRARARRELGPGRVARGAPGGAPRARGRRHARGDHRRGRVRG
jgi:iron(III) transport system permease protein